jgi:predicted Zn-dependent protease
MIEELSDDLPGELEGLLGALRRRRRGSCHLPHGERRRLGLVGDHRRRISQVNVAELTEIAANKALKSRKPRAIEPGRYTTIIEPRPVARLLSTMMGRSMPAAAGDSAAAAA